MRTSSSRSVAFYLDNRVSKCKSNRPVARRNYDLRMETVWWCSPCERELLFHTRSEEKREERKDRERKSERTEGRGEGGRGKRGS